MSNDDSATPHDHSEDIGRWLTIGNSVALVLVLMVMTVAALLIFDLRSTVAALEDQARKSAKAEKALRDELEGVKQRLHVANTSAAGVVLRPTNIDAADPRNDCVIRPGDKNGLAGCIRSDARE